MLNTHSHFWKPEFPENLHHIRKPAFSTPEYRRRLQAVQGEIRQRDLDGLLCPFITHICYLTGYETIDHFGPAMLFVPAEGLPFLLINDFEVFNTLISSWVDDVYAFRTASDPVPAIVELLRHRGWKGRLGWEHDWWGMRSETYARVKDGFAAEWSYQRGTLEPVMSRKSPEEMEALHRAASLSTAGLQAALDVIAEGVTDSQIAAAIYAAAIGGGGEHMALNPIVTVGENSGIPHSNHRGRTVRRGDVVWMELGACVKRYSAPTMRSPVVGHIPDPLWKTMHDACVEAIDLTISMMKPGALAGEISRRASEPLFALPRGIVVDTHRGYSVGLGFEPTWLDAPGVLMTYDEDMWAYPDSRADRQLQPGNVFHVRATSRCVGRFGATVSETVAVTESGCEVLTKFPRGILVK